MKVNDYSMKPWRLAILMKSFIPLPLSLNGSIYTLSTPFPSAMDNLNYNAPLASSLASEPVRGMVGSSRKR
jgi:hypothetical protein